ncbi:hypothetical protein PGB90_006347 [Kerria lacca]
MKLLSIKHPITTCNSSKVRKVENSIKELKTTVGKLSNDFDELKQEQNEIQEVDAMDKDLHSTNRRLNDLEQHSRKNNIIKNGVPESKDENVYEIIEKIGTALEEPLEKNDIAIAHRIPSRRETAPIIVRFNNWKKKTTLIRKSKIVQLTSEKINLNPTQPIYIGDHLTNYSRMLLEEAKKLKNEKKVQFAWYKNGRVFVREYENSPAMRIEEVEDVKELRDKLPVQDQKTNTYQHQDKRKRRATKKYHTELSQQSTLDQYKNITVKLRNESQTPGLAQESLVSEGKRDQNTP